MSQRSAIWLASSLLGFYVLIVAATFGLAWFGSGTSDDTTIWWASGYAVVGALVATRERANAIGWLMLATALGFALSNLSYAYARDAAHTGVVAVAWFASWSYAAWVCIPTMLIPLLFPTGRLLSPRWRVALAVALAAAVLLSVGGALAKELDVEPARPNPLGVGGSLGSIVTAITVVGAVLALTGVVLGAVSLVVRLRRSRGRERQQLKVVAYVVVALLIDICIFATFVILDRPSAPEWVQDTANFLWLPSYVLVSLGLPLAIGVAILRHQLYDIDVVINRTLVYGALTVLLALCYLALVLVFGMALRPLTSDSELAVAGSTLAVAALFGPARTRIQSAVDRRFYRQRFDATRTLAAFTGRLRDELDLETVAADLTAVTRETLQPTHASLWLREADR